MGRKNIKIKEFKKQGMALKDVFIAINSKNPDVSFKPYANWGSYGQGNIELNELWSKQIIDIDSKKIRWQYRCKRCFKWDAEYVKQLMTQEIEDCSFCRERVEKNSKSQGHIATLKILRQLGLEIKEEYTLKGLKDKAQLHFDFAIFNEGEIKYAIEYNGKQHYEPIEYFGGEKQFKNQKRRDNIKRKFCKKNNIKLIEIPYWVEDIEDFLKTNLNKIEISRGA